MPSAAFLNRLPAWVIPAVLLAGLGVSALVGWYATSATGHQAGLGVFILLGAMTPVMTALLAWVLRLAARETARAETALAESREASERFRELVDLSTDWYWEQDEHFRFTVMSGGVVNKGGFRVDATLGRTRWELPIEGVSEAEWADHRALLARHEPFSDFRYDIRVADGTLRTFSISGRPRFDADGRFIGYRGVSHDITHAARSEAALQQSEGRLVKAQEVAQTGSWELDIPADKLTWSEEAFRIFGLASGTPMTYERFIECLHPDDRAAVDAAWAAALEGAPYDIEHRILVDGATRWVRERAEIVRDNEGRPSEGIGTVQDITERKESELQLRLAASVFENSQEGVMITDAERKSISVNRAFTRITGYTADEVIGRNPRLLKSGRQDASFYAAMWLAIEQNGFWSGEVWNRRKNGEIYPEILSITAIRDERGHLLHYIGIFTDITDIKRAEEAVRGANADLERRVHERTAELEASNRELTAFSYSVSHDLRGPLRGIEGFAHVIAEDYDHCLGDVGRTHLARIQQAAKRMAQLIDDLLELARITRADMHRRDVDLSALAHAIAHDLQAGLDRAVHFTIESDLTAWADPSLISTLLDNLLGNAWKFTARQANARIEFGREVIDGERAFFVRDNGAGFDPTYAGKLFQPFQRLHHPDEFAGTGIGLATAKRIVERHGGRVWAESQPGQGATFYFTLP